MDGARKLPVGTARDFVNCFRSFSCPVLLSMVFVGCGEKAEVDLSSAAAPVTNTRPAHPPAPRTKLQVQMEALQNLPHEHEPNKRPLVISQPNTDRRSWLLSVLKQGYEATGRTNTGWDAPALDAMAAYADFSRVTNSPMNFSALTNAVLSAIANGCNDPMLAYMRVRYGLSNTLSQQDYAFASVDVFRSMLLSQYHPLLKFMAGYRAAQAAYQAEPKGNRAVLDGFTTSCLEDLARDPNAPDDEVLDAVVSWADFGSGSGWLPYLMSNLEGMLEKRLGQREPFLVLRGRSEIDRAWSARGGDYADKVTEQGWEQFRTHLNAAALALEAAWQMNSNNAQTAYSMMQVELGQGQGLDRMQKWFDRAMNLAPNNYAAVSLMAFYLEPRWYGSETATLRFCRSCVSSTKWGGSVPLVLEATHHSLARYHKLNDSPEYWLKPGVWDDVQSSYEKFFKLNPDEKGYYHDYARDAYLCGQWQKFLDETKLFPWTNYTFFGSEELFHQMVQHASKVATDVK